MAEKDTTTPTAPAPEPTTAALERRLRHKLDLRLCTITSLLCSLTLLDSSIISSASVTSLPRDLNFTPPTLSLAISILTLTSIALQLPSTLASRHFGPRPWFASITLAAGILTLCTAFARHWTHMLAVRALLGAAMSGVYPGCTYLVSTWYKRSEQQTRFAYLQSGEVVLLATGSIVNFALNERLDGRGGLAGWQYMFLVQGAITIAIGIATYVWMVDFPDEAHRSVSFLSAAERALAVRRIDADREDVEPEPFAWGAAVFAHARDVKVYGFAALFFLQNVVSTALAYFLPVILQGGMSFDAGRSILLSAPPYYYAVVPVLLSSIVGDRFRVRGPVIVFNCVCLVAGFAMLGFARQVAVRYAGTFLATGAYVSNWAALSTYQANNVVGQWKRAFTAAAVTMMNGAGGIAGSFIVRTVEGHVYTTAVWVAIGSHILIILLVLVFSGHFWSRNRLAAQGKLFIEGVEGFRYTL